MSTPHWQKSSYCQEGEACVHISADPTTIRLIESADPTRTTLDTTPTAFGALLRSLKERRRRD
ncbi:DUF397 domain-containing protein [Streptomyces sp. DSM 3412]|uniref:DUF397 domain-containing protein n=1 Tax=Streptomyces gottesmaniae TaxID=3075518 RepID=A0ABU2Z3E1_9ACTN|nr:DUF397 domain-containing protein [Streptomyces sp. DSM 3412]MDT0571102.1 DUF397 domain-containing protein [Streptomyces sp. DSM 3412]